MDHRKEKITNKLKNVIYQEYLSMHPTILRTHKNGIQIFKRKLKNKLSNKFVIIFYLLSIYIVL